MRQGQVIDHVTINCRTPEGDGLDNSITVTVRKHCLSSDRTEVARRWTLSKVIHTCILSPTTGRGSLGALHRVATPKVATRLLSQVERTNDTCLRNLTERTCAGQSFGFTGTITIGGRNCPIAGPYNHESIICSVPEGSRRLRYAEVSCGAGEGAAQRIVVVVNGQANEDVTYFNYDPPVIDTVSPTVGPTAGGA